MILSEVYNGSGCLYHGSAQDLQGNSTLFPYPQTTIAGDEGVFVFATPNYMEAFMYAGRTRKMFQGLRLPCASGEEEAPAILYVVPDGGQGLDDIEKDYVGGSIFEVSSNNFYPVVHVNNNGQVPSRELVSRDPVDIEKVVETFDTLRSLMERGLQIFTIEYSKIKPLKTLSEIQATAAERGLGVVEQEGLLYCSDEGDTGNYRQKIALDANRVKYLRRQITALNGVSALNYDGVIQWLNPQVIGQPPAKKNVLA